MSTALSPSEAEHRLDLIFDWWHHNGTNAPFLPFQACSGRPSVVLIPSTSGISGSRATAPPCGKRGETAEDRERGEEQAQVGTLFFMRQFNIKDVIPADNCGMLKALEIECPQIDRKTCCD